MKKFVLTVLALVAVASPAAAQLGDVSMYADQAGTSCNVTDAPGVTTTYLIHKHTGGATASQFTISTSGGVTMTALSFTGQPDVLFLGGPADLSVSYNGCRVGDFYLGSVLWLSSGSSTPCSQLVLTPAPSQIEIPGEVVMTDCAFTFQIVATGRANVNPNGTCQCDVGVSETTWGSIKALYQ